VLVWFLVCWHMSSKASKFLMSEKRWQQNTTCFLRHWRFHKVMLRHTWDVQNGATLYNSIFHTPLIHSVILLCDYDWASLAYSIDNISKATRTLLLLHLCQANRVTSNDNVHIWLKQHTAWTVRDSELLWACLLVKITQQHRTQANYIV